MPKIILINDIENTRNKVTSLEGELTDEQYPSAKAVKNAIDNIEISGGGSSCDLDNDTNIPEYWEDELSECAKYINTALCTAGRNKSAFLFYSDAHYDNGSRMSPRLLRYLYKNTGVTKTFYGGDIVNTESNNIDTMKYLWDWRKQIKELPNHHSVVGNHDDGNATNNLFSEQYVYGYLLAAEETPDIVRGDDRNYYIDSLSEKTRYLFIDTAYLGVKKEFIGTALKSTPDNWHIIVIAHIWYQPDYNSSNTPIDILPLNHNNSRTSYEICTILDNYNNRAKDTYGDYSKCMAKVELCIGGHTHIDFKGHTDGGIPIILVETDSHNVRSGLTYKKGTITESSVNCVIFDYNTNTVHVARAGRGNSYKLNVATNEWTHTYRIINSLENVTNSSLLTRIEENSRYTAELNSVDDIEYITVIMGNKDITSTAYDAHNKTINIENVTGDVIITAKTKYKIVNLLNMSGCETGYRINSGGNKVAEQGKSVSNIIPYNPSNDDILYMSADIFEGDLNYCLISACDESGNPIRYESTDKVIGTYIRDTTVDGNELSPDIEALKNSAGVVYAYKFQPSKIKSSTATMSRWQNNGISYIIITGNQFTNNSIVTVNQQIEP